MDFERLLAIKKLMAVTIMETHSLAIVLRISSVIIINTTTKIIEIVEALFEEPFEKHTVQKLIAEILIVKLTSHTNSTLDKIHLPITKLIIIIKHKMQSENKVFTNIDSQNFTLVFTINTPPVPSISFLNVKKIYFSTDKRTKIAR